jgi:hypothetical protein
MKDYEELGHMEPMKSQEERQTCYFLPRNPVFKKQAPQQKLELCSMEVPRLPMDGH